MKRGELYCVAHRSAAEPKKSRVLLVVSRQVLTDSRFSTVICAPVVYTACDGLATQVPVGADEGLKHDSSIHCDELVSLPKAALTNFVGTLPQGVIADINQALRVALELPDLQYDG